MTKTQTSKTNMYLGMLIYLSGTMSIWTLLTVFANAVTGFKAKVLTLQAKQALQEELLSGYARDKRNKRIAMVESAYRIKGALQGFASDTNNIILFDKINWSFSKLIEGSSIRSKNFCQTVHDKAVIELANLAPYQVTAADLDKLQTLISAYNDIISNPKKVLGERKQLTEDIQQLIVDIDGILKTKMDKLVANFMVSAPDFYNTYFKERKIYNGKTNFTEVVALFKNKETGHTLEGVVLKATGDKGAAFEILSNASGVADR